MYKVETILDKRIDPRTSKDFFSFREIAVLHKVGGILSWSLNLGARLAFAILLWSCVGVRKDLRPSTNNIVWNSRTQSNLTIIQKKQKETWQAKSLIVNQIANQIISQSRLRQSPLSYQIRAIEKSTKSGGQKDPEVWIKKPTIIGIERAWARLIITAETREINIEAYEIYAQIVEHAKRLITIIKKAKWAYKKNIEEQAKVSSLEKANKKQTFFKGNKKIKEREIKSNW